MDRKFHNEMHRKDLESLIEKTRENVRKMAFTLYSKLEEFYSFNTSYELAVNTTVKRAYEQFDMEKCKLSNYLRMYKRLYGVEYLY